MFFLIEFKLDPGSSVRNYLGQDKGPSRIGFKKHSGGPVQLADDDPLGAVYDETSRFPS